MPSNRCLYNIVDMHDMSIIITITQDGIIINYYSHMPLMAYITSMLEWQHKHYKCVHLNLLVSVSRLY